ncbi:MAG: hypothetical protein ACPKPY_03490, partial [Nitrososphaeraceae archaeon]
ISYSIIISSRKVSNNIFYKITIDVKRYGGAKRIRGDSHLFMLQRERRTSHQNTNHHTLLDIFHLFIIRKNILKITKV